MAGDVAGDTWLGTGQACSCWHGDKHVAVRVPGVRESTRMSTRDASNQ